MSLLELKLADSLRGKRGASLRDGLEILACRLEALPLLERSAHRLLLRISDQRQYLRARAARAVRGSGGGAAYVQ